MPRGDREMDEMEIPEGWERYKGQDRPFGDDAKFDIMWADGSIYPNASAWEWLMMDGYEEDEDAVAYRLVS
jgi:hypothetical protein